jgi:hypothetical protein
VARLHVPVDAGGSRKSLWLADAAHSMQNSTAAIWCSRSSKCSGGNRPGVEQVRVPDRTIETRCNSADTSSENEDPVVSVSEIALLVREQAECVQLRVALTAIREHGLRFRQNPSVRIVRLYGATRSTNS